MIGPVYCVGKAAKRYDRLMVAFKEFRIIKRLYK